MLEIHNIPHTHVHAPHTQTQTHTGSICHRLHTDSLTEVHFSCKHAHISSLKINLLLYIPVTGFSVFLGSAVTHREHALNLNQLNISTPTCYNFKFLVKIVAKNLLYFPNNSKILYSEIAQVKMNKKMFN